MKKDGRILGLTVNDNLEALLFYSICDDIDRFYKKQPFEYLPHDISGRTVYVEMVIARRWLRQMREMVTARLLEKYPNLEQAVWFRPRKDVDKMMVIKRRNDYARV